MQVLIVLVVACLASSQAAYSGYSGPLASPVVNPSGFLADTPEVAAAKAAHFSEVAKVSSPSGYAPGPYNGAPAYNSAPAYNNAPAYHGAPAYNSAPAPSHYQHAGNHYNSASLTPEGFLADSPEVAAAKAAHFAEVAKTQSGPNHGPESYDDGSYRPEYDNPSYNAPAAPAYNQYSAPAHNQYSAPAHNQYSAPAHSHYAAPSHNQYAAPNHGSHYTGPLASPQVTPQGFLQETPEVAAAKAAHFAEFAKAGSHSSHGRYRRHAVLVHTPAHTAPLAPLAYAPLAYSYPYQYPTGYAYSVRTW